MLTRIHGCRLLIRAYENDWKNGCAIMPLNMIGYRWLPDQSLFTILAKWWDNQVTIPGYYLKALLRFEDDGTPRLLGFLRPYVGTVGQIYEYAVPINTIETLTGFDQFSAIHLLTIIKNF